MKNRILFSLIFCLSFYMVKAQLLSNDGATLVIESGATLFVEGGVENKNGGTIDNNGTLEVQGDFDNSATYDGTDAHTVIFSGATTANVTSGGGVFDQVELNKDPGSDINLLDEMTISGGLNFVGDDNKINLGANDLTLESGATVTSPDANEYAVTGGTGVVRAEGLTATSLKFPVGATSTDYNPATLNVTGGSADFTVRVQGTPTDGDGLTGTPLTGGVVDATWDITSTGGATTDVKLEWDGGQELAGFDAALNGVSKNSGAGWDLLAADATGSNPLGGGRFDQERTGVSSFSAFTVGSKEVAAQVGMSITAFLEGPYGAGPLMSDALRTTAGGLIPVDPATEPYSGAGYLFEGFGGGEKTTNADLDQPADADDGVDWVIAELRDAADSSVVVASRAAIITRNGELANEDGSKPVTFFGVGSGNYFVAVRHRNHPGAMSANAVSTAAGFDFTNLASTIYPSTPVKVVGGVNTFPTADVNGDDIINNTDLFIIAPIASGGLINVYNIHDSNMDAIVNNTDLFQVAPNASTGYVIVFP